MTTTLKTLEFGSSNPEHFVHIVSNLFTEEECASIIKSHTELRFSGIPTGTVRTREAFKDPELAAPLWSRLSQFFVGNRIEDEDGQWWRVKGLSPRLRLSKYEEGGQFAPHFDYRRLATINEQSFMSVNVYLNTVPVESKGATRILQHTPDMPLYWNRQDPLTVLGKIQPVLGTASIFRERVWHDGEELLDGEKFLLRTDLMYEREGTFDFEDLYAGLSEKQMNDKAREIGYSLQEGGNSEEASKWFFKAGHY